MLLSGAALTGPESGKGVVAKARWDETDSGIFLDLARVAVPGRAEQIAALTCLAPFAPGDRASVVELAAGDAALGATILECYPHATLTALDGSPAMREAAARRLERFGARARVEPFDLTSEEWFPYLDDARLVVSSLSIHHLDGDGKRQLFQASARRTTQDGALLIADLVEPARAEARELFAATWDAAALRQSVVATGETGLYDDFAAERWNLYRHSDPEMDKPSRLFDQLLWLRAAGFAVVDCFWLNAGHAIYGGYKDAERGPAAPLAFETALAAASNNLM